MDENKVLWKKAAAFHGHVCGGLTIGYKAALYAIELLNLTFSDDEEVVCISENDACGCDAIQVILGCSIGKGNLLFHMTGKQAFSFFNRKSGKSVRLVLKEKPAGMTNVIVAARTPVQIGFVSLEIKSSVQTAIPNMTVLMYNL